jgi:DNA adenine methylase
MTTKKTILRYAGGKSRAIKQFTPYVEDYDTIVSPFIGGGSLEVHWAAMGKEVIAADVFDILVNFWNVLLNNPDALADELSKIPATKEEYSIVKEALMCTPQVQNMLKDWKTPFYKRKAVEISSIKLAAYYYFNHNTSYGPGFLGWPSKIYMNKEKWDKTIAKVRNFSSPNLSVVSQSFEDTIKQNPKSFLYLDPPYYTEKDKDNKMLCGIYPMKNIPVHHDSFDHELLRDCLLQHKGDFVLSYNNCETIREYYSDFEFVFPEWHYSMDIGEKRIGKNRQKRIKEDGVNNVISITKEIKELSSHKDEFGEDSKLREQKIAELKTKRHEILKKESHEILIVKRINNG